MGGKIEILLPVQFERGFKVIWDKIKKQDFVVKILSEHLKSGRLASTYLFTGELESSKEEMARGFACALNCEKEVLFDDCGCVSCSKIIGEGHPDVMWVGAHDAKSIKIEEIRNMMKWVTLKPYEGKWKVFILSGVDRLTHEASNALLKTLEEPPQRTIFCLLAESKSHLLETIQSRSFELRFRPDANVGGPDLRDLKESLSRMQENHWEEVLDSYQSLKRGALNQCFGELMQYFRDRIRDVGGEAKDPSRIASYLKAIDSVYESREALESNANQKLVLSRLAMKLRRVSPELL